MLAKIYIWTATDVQMKEVITFQIKLPNMIFFYIKVYYLPFSNVFVSCTCGSGFITHVVTCFYILPLLPFLLHGADAFICCRYLMLSLVIAVLDGVVDAVAIACFTFLVGAWLLVIFAIDAKTYFCYFLL